MVVHSVCGWCEGFVQPQWKRLATLRKSVNEPASICYGRQRYVKLRVEGLNAIPGATLTMDRPLLSAAATGRLCRPARCLRAFRPTTSCRTGVIRQPCGLLSAFKDNGCYLCFLGSWAPSVKPGWLGHQIEQIGEASCLVGGAARGER